MTDDSIKLTFDNLADPDCVRPSGPEFDHTAVIKVNDPQLPTYTTLAKLLY